MKFDLDDLSGFKFDLEKDHTNKYVIIAIKFLTEIGSTISAMILFIILAIIFGFQILHVFLPVYIFQLLAVESIKLLFKKPRPIIDQRKNIFGLTSTSGSFPSGHTSNIFCVGYLLSLYFHLPIIGIIIFFGLGGIVGLTRIMLGKHFTIDVFVGGITGIFFSWIGVTYFLPIILPKLLQIFPV